MIHLLKFVTMLLKVFQGGSPRVYKIPQRKQTHPHDNKPSNVPHPELTDPGIGILKTNPRRLSQLVHYIKSSPVTAPVLLLFA